MNLTFRQRPNFFSQAVIGPLGTNEVKTNLIVTLDCK